MSAGDRSSIAAGRRQVHCTSRRPRTPPIRVCAAQAVEKTLKKLRERMAKYSAKRGAQPFGCKRPRGDPRL